MDVRAFDNAVDAGVGESNAFTVNITHHVISRTPGYKDYDRLHHLDDGQPYTQAPTDVVITVVDNDEASVYIDYTLDQVDGSRSVEDNVVEIAEAQPGQDPNYFDYSIQLLCKPRFHPEYPVVRVAVTTNNTRLSVSIAGSDYTDPQPRYVVEFTNETWQTAQIVRLTLDTLAGEFQSSVDPEVVAVHHEIVEGDAEYVDLALQSVAVRLLDNDVAGFVGFPTSPVDMTEGQPYNVSLSLASRPVAPVVVTFSLRLNASGVSHPGTDVGLSIVQGGMVSDTVAHTFQPEDWSVPFTVIMEAPDDSVFEGLYSYDLEMTVSSDDAVYSQVSSAQARIDLYDDDPPGVLVAPCVGVESPCVANGTNTVDITEMTAGFYEVRLSSEPTAAVTVTVLSAEPDMFIVSDNPDALGLPGQPATLRFQPPAQPDGTGAWWQEPQRVRIDAQNFNWATTPVPMVASLTHVVDSDDPSYNHTAVDLQLTTKIVPRQLCDSPELDMEEIRGEGVRDGLPTAGQQTRFSVVVKDADGRVCANSYDIVDISIDHPAGMAFPWPVAKPVDEIYSYYKFNPRDEPDSNGTIEYQYTVNPHGPYIITVRAGESMVALRITNNPRPSPVVSARFVDSLESVHVSFTAEIHGYHNYSEYSNYRSGQGRLGWLDGPDGYSVFDTTLGQPNCGTWLSPDTVALLGAGPTCTWTNASQLRIGLGRRYSLAPGDALTFNHSLPGSNVSLIAAYNSAPADNMVLVATAANPAEPVVSLTAPSIIGQCTNLVLDASASLQNGLSRLSFEWSVAAEDRDSFASLPVVDEKLRENSSRVELRYGLLPFGETSYALTVANTHGISQNTTVTVMRSTSPRPTVAIAGARTYVKTAMDVLDLHGAATAHPCTGDGPAMDYLWEVQRCTLSECMWDTLGTQPSVRVEISELDPGHTYTVRLNASDTSVGGMGSAEVEVRVDRSDLISRISVGPQGSGREAQQHVVTEDDGAVLDGSASLDPDRDASDVSSLNYAWVCALLPLDTTAGQSGCPYSSNDQVWDLAASGFDWNGGSYEFTLTVTDPTDSNRHSTSSTYLVIPDPTATRPTVAVVNSPAGKVSPQDRVVLRAQAANRGGLSQLDFRWSSVDLLDLEAVVSGTVDSANLVVNGNHLASGHTYRFRILACAGPCDEVNPARYTDHDDVSVTVNESPTSSAADGAFVSTLSGQTITGSSVTLDGCSLTDECEARALVDEVTMDAGWDWQDEDLPLSYSFAVQSFNDTRIATLTAASPSTSATSVLPAGVGHGNQVVVICIVADSLGASTQVQTHVTVLPTDVDSDFVEEKLSKAEDLKHTDKLLQLVDGVSSLLNNHDGRRRVQASSEEDRREMRRNVLEKLPLAMEWSLASEAVLARILQSTGMATAVVDELDPATIVAVTSFLLDGVFNNAEYESVSQSVAFDGFTVADHIFDTLRLHASSSEDSISSVTGFISDAALATATRLVPGEGAVHFSGSDSFDVTIKKFDELESNAELIVAFAQTDDEMRFTLPNDLFIVGAPPVTARATSWAFNPHDYSLANDGSQSNLVTPVVRLEVGVGEGIAPLGTFAEPIEAHFPSAQLDDDPQHPEKFLSLVAWAQSDCAQSDDCWISIGSESIAGDGRRMQAGSGSTFEVTSLLVGGVSGSPVHEMGVQEILDYNPDPSAPVPEHCSPEPLDCADTLDGTEALADVPAGQFKLVECSSQCTAGVVGTQIYAAQSTICAAARHSCGGCDWQGLKTFAVVIRSGRSSYSASTTDSTVSGQVAIASQGGASDSARSFQIIPRDCVLPGPEPEPEPAPPPPPAPDPPAPPPAVDCQGDWGEWSPCTEACSGGTQTQYYEVTVAADHGGLECPSQEPRTQNCNMQDCPVDCFKEYLPCTAECEEASQRQWNEDTYTPQAGTGAACPSAVGCEPGDGSCRIGSSVATTATGFVTGSLDDDNSGFIVAIVVLALCLAGAVGVALTKNKKKQAAAESEMWNAAAASQQPTLSAASSGGGGRRATTPQRGEPLNPAGAPGGAVSPRSDVDGRSSYSQSQSRYQPGPPESSRGGGSRLDDYGGSAQDYSGGDFQEPPIGYGGPSQQPARGRGRGTSSIRSDTSAVSRKDERAARLEKARSWTQKKNSAGMTALQATRAMTPPRDPEGPMSARRLTPTRSGRTSQSQGAATFAAAATAAAVGATKPRSAAFARAQILLAQSRESRESRESRRAQSAVGIGGPPASPEAPTAGGPSSGRRLTPTRTTRGATAAARPRATTPPRTTPTHEAGDDE
jgi:hypothetical protein